MVDFITFGTRQKRGSKTLEVYPKFLIKKSKDLMIRGGDFYAIWLDDEGLWSTDEQDVIDLIDRETDIYYNNMEKSPETKIVAAHMWDSESGLIDSWHKYCQKQLRDSYHQLDETIIFANADVKKTDYASKKLDYPLKEGSIEAYEKVISTLYSPEERDKIEWAIGSIVSGDSKNIQKFMVFYGAPGSGKSTIINLIESLFKEYCGTFESAALTSASNVFALEAFSSNPLVAVEHDADLSRIETNTRLNSLVSHETMRVNEKFKSPYSSKFRAFLIIGTNKPVKITDAKSGLMRRLIDVSPTGNLLPRREYNKLVKQMGFELGAIAKHCLDVYLSDPSRYDDYQPINMLGASNDFYNFIEDSFLVFKKSDRTTLKAAWEMYKQYCDDAKVNYPLSQRAFKEELKNYFSDFKEQGQLDDGSRVRSLYLGFLEDKFSSYFEKKPAEENRENVLTLDHTESILDKLCADFPAQYANDDETPYKSWDKVKTTLKDLDTKKLHYILLPENHIVVDFDLVDENGEKSLELNLKEAVKWPKTYAELSKSGKAVHLHYIYDGDASKLSRIYSDKIEIKVFTGKSSLRRRLTVCNNEPIATISSGLPLKGEKKVVDFDAISSEKAIRTMIERNLRKEYHANTAPSIDFIAKILNDAYNSGVKYDVSDMRNAILLFASGSTNQASKCVTVVSKMKFKSDEPAEPVEETNDIPIAFYDIEVFPNLLLICWKFQGKGLPVHRMYNPSPSEVETLMKYNLIGFNCRRYDNHIVYARYREYDINDIYHLSQRIINGKSNCFFGEAYNVSYTDVHDFCSKKQSLKKWEIELGIHHQELGFPWDQPVPEDKWDIVGSYCDNDVIALEAVFDARQGDFVARQILAELAHGSINDTTNSLSGKLIFGKDRKPQSQFNYRFMGDESQIKTRLDHIGKWSVNPDYTCFDENMRPIFPGYKFQGNVSTYRGEEIGEGGYVFGRPGMYINLDVEDVSGMHPSSIIAEQLFGPLYTKRFQDIKDARTAIKHKEWDKAKSMLDGALTPYIDEILNGTAKFEAADLAQAMKIVVNSVYGLTAAHFDNLFRDRRNIDNIVAKRGALFMCNLRHEVEDKGFPVIHCKTDSIKIANPTDDILEFVREYGKLYGYEFEQENFYERLTLVNNAVYIARHTDGTWDATGTQFAVPYVFKKCFTKEDICFEDLCETKEVKSAIYIDMNEDLPDAEPLEKELDKLNKKYPDTESLLDIPALDYEQVVSRIEYLTEEIPKRHNYIFVGKVGQFCPMKSGVGAGELVRENIDKKTGVKTYPSVTGCKGYRWMESEVVKNLGLQDSIDLSYYNNLVDEAIEAISQYGDFEWFVSGDISDGDAHIIPF